MIYNVVISFMLMGDLTTGKTSTEPLDYEINSYKKLSKLTAELLVLDKGISLPLFKHASCPTSVTNVVSTRDEEPRTRRW